MSESLAERLAEQLDMQPEQSDRLVRTLAKLIHTQAFRDGSVQVPGLGVFQQTAHNLAFEPDFLFAEAVNPQYARLESLSLSTLSEPGPEPVLVDEPVMLSADAETDTEGYGDTEAADEEGVVVSEAPPSLEAAEPLVDEDEPALWTPDHDDFFQKAETTDPEIKELEDRYADEDEGVSWLARDVDHDLSDSVSEAEPTFFAAEESPTLDTRAEISAEDPYHPDVDDLAASLLSALPEEASMVEQENYSEENNETAPWPLESFMGDEELALSAEASNEDNIEDEDLRTTDLSDYISQGSYQISSSTSEEEDLFEEEEPTAWAPPGTRWAGENQDQLEPIEDETLAYQAASPFSFDSPSDTDEPATPAFASPAPLAFTDPDLTRQPPLHALQTSHDEDLPPRPSTPTYNENAQSMHRSFWPWLLAVFMFIVIAGGAYYYFNMREQPLATNDDPPIVTTDPAEEEPAVVPLENETGDTPAAEDLAPIEEPTPTEAETTASSAAPPVQAGAIDRAAGGYTLIVGSRGTLANAEADADRIRQALNDSSLPVDVLEGTSNGTTRFRIGVGQVESVEAAVALKQRLGNRITADAWVTSISSNR